MLPIWEKLKLNNEVWDLFTRKEEYAPKHLDDHARFTYAQSNYKSILEPHVSKFLKENGFRAKYPDNKKFAVCLTHDVDDIYPPISHMLLSSLLSLKALDLNLLSSQVLWKFSKKWPSPYFNFREIMEMERKFEAKSTFYFLATEHDPVRFRYNIEDISDELKFIVSNGWDVGLHVGYYSFDNRQDIIKEKKRLERAIGKEIIGCRNHYLRFKVPDTWEILAKAGFKYDATVGYTDSIGFRNGMCQPYRPFNLNSNSETNIVEIPLVIMEGSLINMKLDPYRALAIIKSMVDQVEEYNGVLSLLWHNSTFGFPFRQQWAKLYEAILSYCHEKNAWMTSANEIYHWYCENGYESSKSNG